MCLLLSYFPYGNNHKTSNNNRSGEQKGIKKGDGKRGYVVRPLKGFGASFGEKLTKAQIFWYVDEKNLGGCDFQSLAVRDEMI